MRIAFLLLVFANVAFLAYRYYVAHYVSPGADPVAHQLQPDRIRIIPPEELARLAASRRGGPCIELGPIAASDVPRAEEAAAGLSSGLKLQRRVDDPARWWVYIPPLATRQSASQRVAELRKQGIEDSSLVNDEPAWRNAISLGVFPARKRPTTAPRACASAGSAASRWRRGRAQAAACTSSSGTRPGRCDSASPT